MRRRKRTRSSFCRKAPLPLPSEAVSCDLRVGQGQEADADTAAHPPSLNRVRFLQGTQKARAVIALSRCCSLDVILSPEMAPESCETPSCPRLVLILRKKNRKPVSPIPTLLIQALGAGIAPGATNIRTH